MRRFQVVVVATAIAIPLGLVGAWAFNPGDGAVLHSALLWHIFGGAAELGVPLLLVLIIGAAIVGLARRWLTEKS